MSERIKSNTARLLSVVADYQAEIQRVAGSGIYSDDFKQQQYDAAHARAVERAYVTAAQVWGEVKQDENFTKRLDDAGHAWQEQSAAVAQLETARQTARRSGIDPAWFQVSHARAAALVRRAETGGELLTAYDNADPDVRAVLAEFGESLMLEAGKGGRQWLDAIIRFRSDAKAVYASEEYQAAYARLEGVVDSLVEAHKALRGVINTIAVTGDVTPLRTLLHGIEETRRDALAPDGKSYALPAFERHTWGAVPDGVGGFVFTA